MRPSHPERAEFLRLARSHSLVPLYRTLTADLETPVSAFLRVAAAEPECFLLESVEGGERLGRYTYIGIRPSRRIVSHGTEIELTEHGKTRKITGDVFALLRDALDGHSPARIRGLPPFTAGAVGFFSYDVVRQIERLPQETANDLGLPDACLMFFDEVLAFDHVKKEILLIVTADLRRHKPQAAYADALRRLDRLEKRLAQPLPKLPARKPTGKLRLTSRTRKPAFLKAVERAKEYIAAGDIFQVVLSQRLDLSRRRPVLRLPRPAHRQPFALYVFPPLRAEGARGQNSMRRRKKPRTSSARRPSFWFAWKADASSTARLPERARAAPLKQMIWPPNAKCSPTKKSAPST